ncbi:MAG: hypothetical protein E4G95_06530, partial [Bacteroidia bacterium]
MYTVYSRMSYQNSIRSLLIVFLFSLALVEGNSQGIRLNVDSEPLNSVLISLSNSYGIQLSFNDQQLSGYKVTADSSF